MVVVQKPQIIDTEKTLVEARSIVPFIQHMLLKPKRPVILLPLLCQLWFGSGYSQMEEVYGRHSVSLI